MFQIDQLGALLSATARERRKQVPLRALLAILVGWALYSAGRADWIAPWIVAVMAVQAFEIGAMSRFRRADRSPGRIDVILALVSTFVMAALFAGMATVIWSLEGRGLAGFALLIIAGGLFTNVGSGIEARAIFMVSATPYIAALAVMPLLAFAGAPSGDPVLTTLGSILFVGAVLSVYGRVHAARRAELAALDEAGRRVMQAEVAMADRAAMAAIISHELRTPVSAILAGAQVVRDDEDARHRRDTADLIGDAADLMTRMLNDLLDHSKMEAGAMSLEETDFDLTALLEETCRLWAPQATAKGLHLEHEAPATSVWLKGDPYRLRQILNNLMSNAVKFTSEGGIRLEAIVEPQKDGRYRLRVTVTDQGAGVSPDAMERLFTPFAQGSAEVARTYGGTGLGLKVSRDLARLMEGDVTVVSHPRDGAAFTLTVVLATGRPTLLPRVIKPDLAQGASALRVLAVDDHEINRRTLALVLQPLGVQLTTASDGLEALERLAVETFDVVLMDVNMPGLDGNEATRRLRASDGPNAATPIIGFSAGTEADQVQACRDAGMTDWLAKPLEPARLYAALRRATAGDHRFAA